MLPRRTVVFSLTCLILVASGCSAVVRKPVNESPENRVSALPRAAATTSPSVADEPRTWMTVEDQSNNFSIRLPGNWSTIHLDQKSFESTLKEISRHNPKMAEWFSGKLPEMVAKGIKLVAVDVTPQAVEQGYATNLAVMTTDLPYSAPASLIAQYALATVKKMSLSTILVEPHPLLSKAGKGAEFSALLRLKREEGQEATVCTTQAIFVVGKKAYGLTISTLGKPSKSQRALFDEIFSSFSVLRTGAGTFPPTEAWKYYAISNAGVKLDLPEEPDIVDAGLSPVTGDSPFIARTMHYACTSMNIHFEVLVGFYASGEDSDVEDAFVHGAGRASAIAEFKSLRPDDEGGDWKYKDSTTDIRKGKRTEKVWTADFSSGDTTLHMKSSVVAMGHTVYAVAVYYDKTDGATAKAADTVLQSATIELAEPDNAADATLRSQ